VKERTRAAAVAFTAGVSVAVAFMVAIGWRPVELIRQRLRPETAHQRYARSLVEGTLSHTALATEWLASAARAVEHPVTVALPFTENALIDPARPVALGYAVNLKRGQKLDVQVSVTTDTPGRVFIDLFEPRPEGTSQDVLARRPAASADGDRTSLSHEADRSGAYVLRVQPELLRGGHVRVTSIPAASLLFPVSGATVRNLKSVFGDPRDAGRRTHQGVDIFAARGTQVLAASDGVVVSVGENNLGGQVVWLRDTSRGLTYYYAHLHEQLVRPGARVRAGDALGTVGNTGNARTTAPHLHFGIYARGEGPLDPDAFIRPIAATPVNPAVETSTLGAWGRTRERASVRASPSAAAPVLDTLPRASTVRVEGSLGPWIRTRIPGHPTAFLSARDLAIARGDETP
jgi:murein DD-endopeptidase MepM/ murein hydrolase activator NlpD